MPAITATASTAVARPLKVLIPLIHEDIEAGRRAGLPFYRAAGEKLIEAKAQVKHGEWEGWVKRNFDVTKSTAATWMRLAESTNGKSSSGATFRTLSEFREPNRGHHQPAWHEPIRDVVNTVNVERLNREQVAREQEAKMVRDLCLKIIDIGYKALAAKLHPDRGGSTEAMARLNRAKATLRDATEEITS